MPQQNYLRFFWSLTQPKPLLIHTRHTNGLTDGVFSNLMILNIHNFSTRCMSKCVDLIQRGPVIKLQL